MRTAALMMTACLAAVPALAALAAPSGGPALDLDIAYYTKVLTPEGVTREARYNEIMIRRPGHVWVERVLPKAAGGTHYDESRSPTRTPPKKGIAGHTEFNHVVIPRHVLLEKSKVRVEYVDAHGKAVVAIPPSEYANVNFDGSWGNAYFLVDPALVKSIPRSARRSEVPGAQWHEREKDGVFERVLWDEARQVPLMIESGDRLATFYRRVEVTPRREQVKTLPWQNLTRYSQKEFADYLD